MKFLTKKGAMLSFVCMAICSSTSVGDIIQGKILDAELGIPVKNVVVNLENISDTSDEKGHFALDVDKVSIVGPTNQTIRRESVRYNGSNKSVQIETPYRSPIESIQLRTVTGKSLCNKEDLTGYSYTLPLESYATGRYVLTVRSKQSVNHYWLSTTATNSYTLQKSTLEDQHNSRGFLPSYMVTCSKAGYDTSYQDLDTISDTMLIEMDRFTFCGNDVAEEDEVCDGDSMPCNVVAPLSYALGESPCNSGCSDYKTDECVPHPVTDVSGNSNGTNHKKAYDITVNAHFSVLQQIQVGMIEGNFHDIIDSIYDAGGANGLAFNHITGSGPNSIILHYEGKNRTLKDGDVLLVDIGAKYNNYCADITRTYPVNGKFTERQREIYQLVLDAKQATEAEMVPGVHSLNQMTTFVKNFFKASPLRAKDKNGYERTMDYFFKHGLCHYIGTQVHGQDLPYTNSEPVKAGRLFTIEPGIYIDSEGFGVRLEDTYIMTAEGAKKVTPNLPIEVDHIEAIMAARKLDRSADSYNKEYEEVKTRSSHMDF